MSPDEKIAADMRHIQTYVRKVEDMPAGQPSWYDLMQAVYAYTWYDLYTEQEHLARFWHHRLYVLARAGAESFKALNDGPPLTPKAIKAARNDSILGLREYGNTQAEISAALGVSRATVSDVLKKANA